MCTVANVSAQASGGGSSGHGALASFIGLFLPSTVWSSACRASALRAGGSQHRLHGHGPPPARSPAFPLFEPSSGGSRGRNRHAINPLPTRSEEHTSELQSLMRIAYAVFCLKKKTNAKTTR